MNLLNGKAVIVVAGGTREYIDDVRVLTNISSGKLGAMIADELLELGAHVIYIAAKGSILPQYVDSPNMEISIISTVADLIEKLEHYKEISDNPELYDYAPELDVDAVFMAVAASDFTFKRDGNVKLKSSDPEAFVEYMRKTITTNPKVINRIKEWFPKTLLVGFKFEVGLEHEKLIETARKAMEKNGADLIIANDKAEMEKEEKHIGYLVTSIDEARCEGKHEIATESIKYIGSLLKYKVKRSKS